VYRNIQRVVKPVWQPVWTVLNEQPLFVQPVVKPGCTTGLTAGCIHDTAGCETGCQTGLTTGWMFVYTIQPVVKPVWQQVVSCKGGFSNLGLYSRFSIVLVQNIHTHAFVYYYSTICFLPLGSRPTAFCRWLVQLQGGPKKIAPIWFTLMIIITITMRAKR